MLFLLISNFTLLSQSRGLVYEEDTGRFCDDVMLLFEKGEEKGAIHQITNALKTANAENLSLPRDLPAFLQQAGEYGKVTGSERVKIEQAGESAIRYTYVLLHEWHPVWLQYTFYKGEKSYLLKAVDWGDEVEALF